MNKLKITDKVFVPVNPINELPKEDDFYLCSIVKKEDVSTSYYFKEIKFYVKDNYFQLYENEVIIYWLKEETNKYVLSKEQMEQVISNAIQFGINKQSSFEIGGGKNVKLIDLTNEFQNSIL